MSKGTTSGRPAPSGVGLFFCFGFECPGRLTCPPHASYSFCVHLNPKKNTVFETLLIVSFAVAILMGVTLGIALAATRNISVKEQFGEHQPALPTKILDI